MGTTDDARRTGADDDTAAAALAGRTAEDTAQQLDTTAGAVRVMQLRALTTMHHAYTGDEARTPRDRPAPACGHTARTPRLPPAAQPRPDRRARPDPETRQRTAHKNPAS
uniref:hypothetical protein n=1 Tax=Amycolatopsis sp. CA-096443 TaxID=3239919 RepID=UPI003F493FBA